MKRNDIRIFEFAHDFNLVLYGNFAISLEGHLFHEGFDCGKTSNSSVFC